MRIVHSYPRPPMPTADACARFTAVTRETDVRRRNRFCGWATLAVFVALAATFGAPSDAQAQATVTLTSDINQSIWGQAVTFTATVTPPEATGTVTFKDSLGATSVTILGIVALGPGGTAQLIKSDLFVGAHETIIARYNGDGGFAAVTSDPISHEVIRAASTTSLTSDPEPSEFGQNVKLTASVTVGASGRVDFYRDGIFLGSDASVNAQGEALLFTQYMPVGTHNLTANYLGDVHYEGSVSPVRVHNVTRTGTTTVATASPNPALCKVEDVTVTATVTPNDGSPPAQVTGTVEFTSSNPFDCCVNCSPTSVTVTTDVNPSIFGGAVAITVTILPIGPTGRVRIRDISTTPPTDLGTAALNSVTGLAKLTSSTLPPINRILQADYPSGPPDPRYCGSVSPPYNQTIERRSSTTELCSDVAPVCPGPGQTLPEEAIQLIARVTVGEFATGTVEFFDGETSLGPAVPVDPVPTGGVALFDLSPPLSLGQHTLSRRCTAGTRFSARAWGRIATA